MSLMAELGVDAPAPKSTLAPISKPDIIASSAPVTQSNNVSQMQELFTATD